MRIKKAEMAATAVYREQYPAEGLPEIAFAGRSNVGKSSLINCIVNRKSLARTSSQPGKTRTINFYRINENFFMVDLPGYGYAKVSKNERIKWGKMINRYLNTRTTLHGVVQLVDMRHKPNQLDIMMYNWIREAGFAGIIAATKADKISRGRWEKHLKIIIETLEMDVDDIIVPFSAVSGEGKDELIDVMDMIIPSV